MTKFLEHGKIDDQVTKRDSDTRFTFFQLKDPEWEILNGKMRIARDVDE
jgi:hypothetical protein